MSSPQYTEIWNETRLKSELICPLCQKGNLNWNIHPFSPTKDRNLTSIPQVQCRCFYQTEAHDSDSSPSPYSDAKINFLSWSVHRRRLECVFSVLWAAANLCGGEMFIKLIHLIMSVWHPSPYLTGPTHLSPSSSLTLTLLPHHLFLLLFFFILLYLLFLTLVPLLLPYFYYFPFHF